MIAPAGRLSDPAAEIKMPARPGHSLAAAKSGMSPDNASGVVLSPSGLPYASRSRPHWNSDSESESDVALALNVGRGGGGCRRRGLAGMTPAVASVHWADSEPAASLRAAARLLWARAVSTQAGRAAAAATAPGAVPAEPRSRRVIGPGDSDTGTECRRRRTQW